MRKLTVLAAAVLLAAIASIGGKISHRSSQASRTVSSGMACPAGYIARGDEEAAAQRAGFGERGDAGGGSLDQVCVSAKHAESPTELVLRQEELETKRSAPYDTVAPGAYVNAVNQHQQLATKGPKVAGTGGASVSAIFPRLF